jgi:hypothetical protein
MIAGTFNEWLTLQHKSQTDDGQGGVTFSYETYASERGRVGRLGKTTSKSTEVRFGGQLQERSESIIYLRPGLFGTIVRGDRIIDSEGITYEVLDVRHPSALPRRHVEAECREVQTGE